MWCSDWLASLLLLLAGSHVAWVHPTGRVQEQEQCQHLQQETARGPLVPASVLLPCRSLVRLPRLPQPVAVPSSVAGAAALLPWQMPWLALRMPLAHTLLLPLLHGSLLGGRGRVQVGVQVAGSGPCCSPCPLGAYQLLHGAASAGQGGMGL